jgi:hypothetical protein
MGHPGMGYPMSMGPSSVPPSIISGATTVRRARSVAEISHHGLAYSQPPTPGNRAGLARQNSQSEGLADKQADRQIEKQTARE